ncbi:MAG: hypothetical protein ACJZ88_07360 [Paracoccus marcusii]
MANAITIRKETRQGKEIRLVQQGDLFHGMVAGKPVTAGPSADTVWEQTIADIGKHDPRYFGLDGAIRRFRKFFPEGFSDPSYEERERNYKLKARNTLIRNAPLQDVLEARGDAEELLRAYRELNLLAPQEKTVLQNFLRSADGLRFGPAIARFAIEADAAALRNLEAVLRPHGADKWTIVTYLPYLWIPGKHIFLKPEVTKDFAARIGHPLAHDYEARLNIQTYDSLLDLARQTFLGIAELAPRDMLDVQSFIWTVGAYQEKDLPASS